MWIGCYKNWSVVRVTKRLIAIKPTPITISQSFVMLYLFQMEYSLHTNLKMKK